MSHNAVRLIVGRASRHQPRVHAGASRAGGFGVASATVLLALTAIALRPSAAAAYHLPAKFHLVHVDFIGDPHSPEGIRVNLDGMDATKASDGSTVVMSGEGSFDPDFRLADGGGHYRITNGAGELQVEGAWKVLEFLSFERMPGGFPEGFKVEGPPPPAGTVITTGILTMRVELEDHGSGVLEVHCRLPTAPNYDQLLEGVVLTVGDSKFSEPVHVEGAPSEEATAIFVPEHMPMSAAAAGERIMPATLPATGHGPDSGPVWAMVAGLMAALAGVAVHRRRRPGHAR